jgi:hypothetical protein
MFNESSLDAMKEGSRYQMDKLTAAVLKEIVYAQIQLLYAVHSSPKSTAKRLYIVLDALKAIAPDEDNDQRGTAYKGLGQTITQYPVNRTPIPQAQYRQRSEPPPDKPYGFGEGMQWMPQKGNGEF